MKNKLIIAGATLLFSFPSFSQDAKAKEILDAASAKTKAYKSFKADFTYTMENKTEKINEKQTGTLITKGNKFHLVLAGQEVFSDGKAIYTYIKDANEMQINAIPSEAESDETISPNNIFTMYEKGFKYKYEKEEKIEAKTFHIINLYPVKPKEKTYHTITLSIDAATKQINKIKISGKDGTIFTYQIKTFEPDFVVDDTKFTFNKSKYPKAEIVDLRE